MPKVHRIHNTLRTEEAACALWTAAGKVFEIPEWDAVAGWLAGRSRPALREQVSPHRGPSIGLMYDFEGPCGVHILTNGGRYVDLRRNSYDWYGWYGWIVSLEFPAPGSIVAAGEVVRHAWDVPKDSWAEIVMTDGTSINLDDYPGPVGRDLYLVQLGLPAPVLLKCAERGDWSLAGDSITEDTLPAFLEAAAHKYTSLSTRSAV